MRKTAAKQTAAAPATGEKHVVVIYESFSGNALCAFISAPGCFFIFSLFGKENEAERKASKQNRTKVGPKT